MLLHTIATVVIHHIRYDCVSALVRMSPIFPITLSITVPDTEYDYPEYNLQQSTLFCQGITRKN